MLTPRNISLISLIVLLVLALMASALYPSSSSATDYPLTLTDDLGRSVTITQQPQRIISLAPSNTEILFALGLEDKIVGVTSYCDYPTEATSKPSVGGPYTPNNEAIVALNPDLILAAGINPADNINALATLGLTVFGIEATNLTDLLGDIQTVGRITGAESEATALTNNMQTRIAAVNARSATLSTEQKPRVMHIMWHDPVWTAGANTFINDLIVTAGGINIFADLNGYNSVSIEAVLARDPQIIIVTAMGGVSSGTWGWVTAADSPLKLVSAHSNNKIYYVESNWLERPGPRVILGLEAMVEYFHPGLYVPAPQEDSIEQAIKYASPDEAAQTLSELEIDEAARLIGDNSLIKKERAGLILDQLDKGKRGDIIQAMGESATIERLPEVSPEKLFELSPQKLFEMLPTVPAEQLTGEIPPAASDKTSDRKEVKLSYTDATYQVSEAPAGEWTDYLASVPQYSLFASASPFTSLMIKPNKDLSDITATLEVIRQKPAGVPLPGGQPPYLNLYFDISVENMQPQEMEAARVVFKLQKYILDFTSNHKWSVMFNHWNETQQQWIPIPTKRIAEDNQFVYYSAAVSGFSTFCITGSKEIPNPKFEVSDLTISPTEAAPGEKVTITATVKNLTEETLIYPASLWIDQTIDKAQDFEVPAGDETELGFTLAPQTEGEHQVRIDKQMGAFTIKDDPNPPEITSVAPEGSIEEESPTISIRYDDSQSGIDTNSISFLLDGNDITSAAQISETGIDFIPDEKLGIGKHTVSVTLADTKGNETSREWGFTIEIHPVFPGQQNAARDLNQDGLYEDINGDGRVDIFDGTILFTSMGCQLLRDKTERFDFNGNGEIDFGDVIRISGVDPTGTPTLSLGKARCETSEIISLPITLYHVESGLSGFDLTISLKNTGVAQIVGLVLPGFGIDETSADLPSTQIRIRAIDTNNILTESNASMVLGWLKIKAVSEGESPIDLHLREMQDDNGEKITPQIIPGLITIQ